ncbi:MAG TPA: methyltransferase domain-containing protein [Gemmatimonadales bacterium]|jgi:SAM-dependent methyltransferase
MPFPRLTWRQKAVIQNAVARLPAVIGDRLYYALQRTFGGMRHVDPEDRFRAGLEIAQRLEAHGGSVTDATVVEIGTGWRLNAPLALWLLGAACVITVDLHRYLRPALVRKDLATIRAAPDRFRAMFGERAAGDTFQRRFSQLLAFRGTTADLMRLTAVDYRAPVATRLPLPNQSVDAHVSFTVLEHIPADTLAATLQEGRRVLRPRGLMVHGVDFSDHSAHNDPSISPVNFLQYDDATWARLAGNRYAFHNRLRVDEFAALVDSCGVETVALDALPDAPSIAALEAGLPLASRFQGKSPAVNGVTHAWLVAR